MWKKILSVVSLLFILMMLFSKVKAEASLNGNELEVVELVQGGFSYNGILYIVPQEYINQGINYLKQEGVDLTSQQKNKVFSKIKELTPWAIEKGYLIPVEKEHLDQNKKEYNKKEQNKKSQVSTKTVLQSSETLMKEMGMTIQFDMEKRKVQVADQYGRIVLRVDAVMKDTGFYMQNTLFVLIGMIILMGGCICIGCRCDFFVYEEN